ncbi:MAG: hypothetical protein FJ117_02210 [Deltaproteobacteria bacterium]|nr:hypothetical protein [Deltaproteobacteria bacterium]
MADLAYSVPDNLAQPWVEEYLRADEHTPPIIPKRVRRELLDRILREKVDVGASVETVWRGFELVAYYGLREMLPYFAAFLGDGKLHQPDLSRAAAIVMMMAYAGDEGDRQRAQDYYETRLITRRDASANLELLLRCVVALGPRASTGSLRSICGERRTELDARQHESDRAYIEAQRLHRFMDNDLVRAEKAIEVRREVEGLGEEARFTRVVRIYCGLDMAFPEHLYRWSAYWLLRKAEKGAEDAGSVVGALRREVQSVEAAGGVDDATNRFIRTRLLRAVEYFAPETITAEEKVFLGKALTRGQDDMISMVQPR